MAVNWRDGITGDLGIADWLERPELDQDTMDFRRRLCRSTDHSASACQVADDANDRLPERHAK